MFRTPQVNLYSNDVERSVAFYRSLGFVEAFRTPEQGRPSHVELTLDGLRLGVASADAARDVHGLRVSPGAASAEVVVWCDDVDGAHETLVAAGAPSLSAPHDFLDGALRVAWVTDPDGNPVELAQHRDR